MGNPSAMTIEQSSQRNHRMITGSQVRTSLPVAARFTSWAAILLPATMLLFGGGSQANPRQQLLAQLAGIALLCVTGLATDWRRILREDRFAAALLLALAMLFLIQLIPLPADLWPQLPGRALYAQGDVLMFGRPLPRPLSLDPGETFQALLFLIPALSVWLQTRHDPTFGRRFVHLYLAFLAASLVLALAQLAAGPGVLRLYPTTHDRLPTGFFANRNHQAIAMACGIPLVAALHRIDRAGSGPFAAYWAIAASTIACVIGTLLTGSRTGAVLLLPALAAGLAIAICHPDRHAGGRRTIRAAGVAGAAIALLAVIGVAVFAYRPGGALGLVFTRSLVAADPRYAFWPVVNSMIRASWPWGIGFGNFRYAFEVASTPAVLRPLYINHAHNDWLEYTLEGGAAGVLLALAFVAWLGLRWRQARSADPAQPISLAAGAVIGLLLAHSVSDYPLRTIALSTCFAFCMAALSPASLSRPEPRQTSGLRLAVAGLLALVLSGTALDLALRNIAIRAGQTRLATTLPAPGSRLLALHALQLAQSGAPFGTVASACTRAAALSPLSEPAFTAAALASPDKAQAADLLAHAWQLSRRDPVLLATWLRENTTSPDPRKALAAIDALYRLQFATPAVVRPLGIVLAEPAFLAEAVRVTAAPAPWRATFLADLAAIPAARPALSALAGALQKSAHPLAAEEMQAAIASLNFGRTPDPTLAFRLWTLLSPGADALAWPPASPSRGTTPFDWTLADNARISINGAAHRLEYGEATPGVPVASKRLPLTAGRYRAAIAASHPDAVLEVACGAIDARLSDQDLLELPSGCALADVRLFAGAGGGWIGSVALLPAR
jgi:O-antigen ligase